jgi:hypothetical protein
MSGDPTRYFRRRFGAAIDWRVRDAVAASVPELTETVEARTRERDSAEAKLVEFGKLLADVSATLTDQQRVLGELLEQFDRRLKVLEAQP